ncbi:uncharacterized protein LOC121896904 [Thunnus maccoyii]|uniref:uncharacterized protein LOC121896904 n=1 Tax=Thunnus maccoyii TaxID=8240 RepID=UPI001C4C0327|nr:uncharacterized protein LOC121896904 [Thunnus maccoyii]XP_042266910.1 uncharacterized protein LOC121896904 [Thunnus maccoyii]XP_042266911.1 uncharacterized protein LOC121896904 [Thunnus maccoyii]
MDLRADSGNLNTQTIAGGPETQQELSLSSAPSQTESGGTILLQLLEFKTHLLEAVEELHIRRDAETRFEDQISKLLLEKQELEWEKESLQHQIETVTNQHTESLTNVKKQLQAKIRKIEEEKGKYQISAELKDKEINNLKEELKLLQLLKYNLEKKSSELGQKLALQSRSKDSHLNQLGEVEKRFSALSRQCATVKQAHEKLEQNVDEAMRINNKLTSANEKQEATIVSLKKELEEVSNKLIKTKMLSVRHDKTQSPSGREQHVQQLHQKLNTETEMNKKLRDETVAVRAEKQEVMKTLEHTQQLLLNQTHTVSRIELELQTQEEQYQALKQEHEVMREKSKAMEDKVAQLMESYTASKTVWDKEKTMFLDRIKSEQQDHQAVKEAYDELHQKHTELSAQAKAQAQHLHELERRDCSQSLSVSTELFPTLLEGTRGARPLNEPNSSSELTSFGSLQHLASSQHKNSDCLEDTSAVTKLVATGAMGGQEASTHHLQSQYEEPPNISNLFTFPLDTNNVCSLNSLSGKTSSDTNILNKYMNNSNTSERDSDMVSDVMCTTSSVSDDSLLISKSSCVSSTITASSPDHTSIDGSVPTKENSEEVNRGTSETEQDGKDDNREEEDRNKWNREDVQGEDVKEGGHAGEKRGTLMTQTTDRVDRQECRGGDARKPKTEIKDRAEGAERGKTETPEPEIQAQTTSDKNNKYEEKSNIPRVIDFMDSTETPLTACEPSDSSQSLSQVIKTDADSSHVNKGGGMGRGGQLPCTFSSDESLSVSHGSNPLVQAVQHLCQDAESLCHLPSAIQQVFEKNIEERLSDKSDFPAELSERSSQTISAQSGGIVNIQDLQTTQTQTETSNPPDIASIINHTDEMRDTKVSEEGVLVSTMIKPQALPQSQEISEQENGQLKSLVTDGQTNVNSACETAKETVEKFNLKDASDNIDPKSQVETCQEHFKNDKQDVEDLQTTESEADLKLFVHQNYNNDASPGTDCSKHHDQPVVKDMLLDDTNESPLPFNKTYRSSFDWGGAQRKTEGSTTTSVSVLHQFAQGPHMSEQCTSGGFLGHPPSTIPMFLKSKQKKVPLVITRASDLLNASSVSGTAASSRRHQQGEWKAVGETCRETTSADMESRVSLSITSFPASTSASAVSRQSWQTTSGCSRTTPTAGPKSESDWELSCSQEREEQQSSFRAQISKIEQFLNTERLRLPKRRRTDN